jgi:cell division protein FtsW (lipid II flippase)
MPYKDIERKKEWERLHQPQRLARRQELRRIKAEQGEARPEVTRNEQSAAGFLAPLVAGGILAACNPELGMAVGGLTLVIAAVGKKGWQWWIVGIVVLVVALFSYFSNENAEELGSGRTE